MSAIKHQPTIDTSSSHANADRVLTSQNLKNLEPMTSQCLEAINAFWYPLALSADLIHPDAKIELAFLVDERKLSVYIESSNDDRSF
jgi:phosphoribosylaminoimidazole-succinocarboxamide synthase